VVEERVAVEDLAVEDLAEAEMDAQSCSTLPRAVDVYRCAT
jgi:hypothetical protein